MTMRARLSTILGLSALALAASAHADQPTRPSPPQEAFDACASAKEGDTCTVKHGDHEMQGTCATFPERGLVCRPSGPPPIPKEAYEACASAKEGATCSVTFGDHTMQGTCEAAPDGALACRPSGGPPPPNH
jgi:hypothetical protein